MLDAYLIYLDRKERVWKLRKRSFSIGRIAHIGNKIEELYYLRILLNYVKGPQSFEDIRTLEGVTYATFKDACKVLGLFDDDKEYILGIEEVSNWSSGYYLRRLFVIMLISDCLTEPELVWNSTWEHLTNDILYHHKKKHNNLGKQYIHIFKYLYIGLYYNLIQFYIIY